MTSSTAPVYRVGKICYLEVPAGNIARSADFYHRVFGWSIRHHDDGSIALDDTVGGVSGMWWCSDRPPMTEAGLMVSVMVADARPRSPRSAPLAVRSCALQAQPGGEKGGRFPGGPGRVRVAAARLCGRDVRGSTLFMLRTAAAQGRCLAAAARHLTPGGRLFVEAFRPDPSRFDTAGRRTDRRRTLDGVAHEVRSLHDPAQHAIHITHLVGAGPSNSPTR